MKNTTILEHLKRQSYLVNTTSGPAIRWWEPCKGWHFALWDDKGFFCKGDPCDYRVITEIIKPI